jgi:hypothetical protein
LLGALLFSLFVCGCRHSDASDKLALRAQFGVFFGGQVQEREQIPFDLDPARQQQGIRIVFSHPLTRVVHVSWEIDRPLRAGGAAAHARREPDRAVDRGAADVAIGQTRFETLLPFKPGDALGTWNVRVLIDGRLVIDRRFLVYDPKDRARALHLDGGR